MDCKYTYKAKTITDFPIEKKEDQDIEVHPVPMEDALHVSLKIRLNAPAFLTLMDAVGKTIYAQTINSGAEILIPTSYLPHGFYILKVHQRERLFVKKVLK